MNDQELDAVYTELCRALGAAGEAEALALLGRFALLAILEINDRDRLRELIEQAAQAA